MKNISLFTVTFAILVSFFMAYDAKCYAEPPRPATDTTQNTPGPTVSEPDTGRGVREDNTSNPGGARTTADSRRTNRPDYGWLGLLGLSGLFGLAGRNRKEKS